MKVRLLFFTLRFFKQTNKPYYSMVFFKTFLSTNERVFMLFAREAFLCDYIIKMSFLRFLNFFILQVGILFNFNFLNKLYLNFIYSLLKQGTVFIRYNNNILFFFKLLIKFILWLVVFYFFINIF